MRCFFAQKVPPFYQMFGIESAPVIAVPSAFCAQKIKKCAKRSVNVPTVQWICRKVGKVPDFAQTLVFGRPFRVFWMPKLENHQIIIATAFHRSLITYHLQVPTSSKVCEGGWILAQLLLPSRTGQTTIWTSGILFWSDIVTVGLYRITHHLESYPLLTWKQTLRFSIDSTYKNGTSVFYVNEK